MRLSKKQQSLGAPFEDDDGAGIIYCGRKHYTSRKDEAKAIPGAKYKIDGCNCGLAPWELCKETCEHRL